MNTIILDGDTLTLEKLNKYLYENYSIKISNKVANKLKENRNLIKEYLKRGLPIYGINTGLGALVKSKVRASKEKEKLIIEEHAIGFGKFVDKEIAKATILILTNQLAKGNSFIKIETLNRLLEIANSEYFPLIHEEGSLGASGDLIPLASLAQCIIGNGNFSDGKRILKGEKIFGKYDLDIGEAISLINSTAFTTASLAVYIELYKKLLDLSCGISALTAEALISNSSEFTKDALSVKRFDSQVKVGLYLLKLIENSKLINVDKNTQDPYSIRCLPQIIGSIRNYIEIVEEHVINEMNSYSGNPVVILEKGMIYNAGNFHAQLLSFDCDILRITIAALSSLIERKINRILNPNLNKGLPPFLAKSEESSGLMLLQYLSAYHANQCKLLAQPSSFNSIPTSADQEDFSSMSGNGISLLKKSLENLKVNLAIEAYCSYEALNLRGIDRAGMGTKYIYKLIDDLVKDKAEINEKLENLFRNLEKIAELQREKFGSIFK